MSDPTQISAVAREAAINELYNSQRREDKAPGYYVQRALNQATEQLRAERDDLLLQCEQLRHTLSCCAYDSARANPGK